MNLETRNCCYCDKAFTAEINSTKKHCSNTCKVYASQERNGKRRRKLNLPKIKSVDGTGVAVAKQRKVTDKAIAKYQQAKREYFDITDLLFLEIAEDVEQVKKAEIESLKIQIKELEIEIVTLYYAMECERNRLTFLRAESYKDMVAFGSNNFVEHDVNLLPSYRFDYPVNNTDIQFSKEYINTPYYYLFPLGTTFSPFTAVFIEEKNYELETLMIRISICLQYVYGGKILHIADADYNESVAEIVSRFCERLSIEEPDVNFERIIWREVLSRLDTTNSPFVFIHYPHEIDMDYETLYLLKKNNPLTSFFVLINEKDDWMMQELLSSSEIQYVNGGGEGYFMRRNTRTGEMWDYN